MSQLLAIRLSASPRLNHYECSLCRILIRSSLKRYITSAVGAEELNSLHFPANANTARELTLDGSNSEPLANIWIIGNMDSISTLKMALEAISFSVWPFFGYRCWCDLREPFCTEVARCSSCVNSQSNGFFWGRSGFG